MNNGRRPSTERFKKASLSKSLMTISMLFSWQENCFVVYLIVRYASPRRVHRKRRSSVLALSKNFHRSRRPWLAVSVIGRLASSLTTRSGLSCCPLDAGVLL